MLKERESMQRGVGGAAPLSVAFDVVTGCFDLCILMSFPPLYEGHTGEAMGYV